MIPFQMAWISLLTFQHVLKIVSILWHIKLLFEVKEKKKEMEWVYHNKGDCLKTSAQLYN